VVLVEPDAPVLATLAVPVRAVDQPGPAGSASPDCSLPEAATAGDATVSADLLYGPASGASPAAASTVAFCYPSSGVAAALAVVAPAGATGRFVLLGGTAFLTNGYLAQDGDAALALGLLARHTQLSWVSLPRAVTGSVDGKSITQLLGRWFWLAFAQLVLAVALLALWRGRRLGPPVPEPLPVVVRASETTEGRGRLYAAARARETAAEALRAGLRARLADRLGVAWAHPGAPGPDPAALVASVAERTGRAPRDIGALLYGAGGPSAPPAPGDTKPPKLDDTALLRLAEALDDLDRQMGGR
jgi:hypothetical protein